MSATEPRPLRADARRNRERIVAASRELFAQCGQAAQMDDIARRAGVGVGTVYRHFPTKDALVGELLRAKFTHHAAVAQRWASETDNGWDALEGFVRESFAEMAQDAALQRMMWVTSEVAMDYAEDARRELEVVVGGIIATAKAEATLRADFSVAEMPALMCSIGGVMSAQNSRVVEHWRSMVEIVIDGLRAR